MPSLSTGTMSVGILAVAAGLVGAYGVRSALVKETTAVEEAEVFEIPLASADLPSGRTIAIGDMGIAEMTVAEMREQGFPTSLLMRDAQQVQGRTLKVSVKQGEPFLTTSVYLEGQGPDVTGRLKPGFRAMNIQLDRTAVLPAEDDRVDVVFRASPRSGDGDSLPIPEVTKTILQGVEVLAVDVPRAEPTGVNTGTGLDLRRVNQRNSGPPPAVVTLSVNLEQANILQTVQGRGTLNLVVRSRSESLPVSGVDDQETYTLENLLGIKPPPPPPQAVLFRTDIYRAGQRSSTVFVGGVVQTETGEADDEEPAEVPNSDDAAPLLPPTEDEEAAAGES